MAKRGWRRARSVMTIVESDSSGSGGVQADVRTLAAMGVHPLTVITQIAARGVPGGDQVLTMPVEAVITQMTGLWDAMPCDGIKLSQLATPKTAQAVAKTLEGIKIPNPTLPVVTDPALFDRSGKRKAHEGLDEIFSRKIVRMSSIVVLNVFEAEALTGRRAITMSDRRDALRALKDLGAEVGLVVSSANDKHAVDMAFDGVGFEEFGADRRSVDHLGGGSAVLASALAALLVQGMEPLAAIERARRFITAAIDGAIPVARDFVPLNPMAPTYEKLGLRYDAVEVKEEESAS